MPSSTAAIAQELAALCREGKNLEAISRLYSPAITSVEPVGNPEMPAEMHGIDAIRGKNEWWLANHDIHAASVKGPYLGETEFVLHFDFDVTFKPTGQRMKMEELAHYTVQDGKIVREQFFYHAPGQ